MLKVTQQGDCEADIANRVLCFILKLDARFRSAHVIESILGQPGGSRQKEEPLSLAC